MRIQNLIQVQILGYLGVRSDKNNADFVQKRLAQKKMLTYYFASQVGSVAERLNATVLKTVEGLYPSVSSNLTASAK